MISKNISPEHGSSILWLLNTWTRVIMYEMEIDHEWHADISFSCIDVYSGNNNLFWYIRVVIGKTTWMCFSFFFHFFFFPSIIRVTRVNRKRNFETRIFFFFFHLIRSFYFLGSQSARNAIRVRGSFKNNLYTAKCFKIYENSCITCKKKKIEPERNNRTFIKYQFLTNQ